MVQAKAKTLQKPNPKKQSSRGKKNGKPTNNAQFVSQLDGLGLKIVPLVAGGNCFFRGIADQMEGNEEEHAKYRQMVVEYIKKHREEFEPFIEDDVPFDEYCQSMEGDGTWAGHMEIQAASLVCRSDICIHRVDVELSASEQAKTWVEKAKSHNGGKTTINPSSIKIVISGSGCIDPKKVEGINGELMHVLQEVHGNVDAAIEFLLAEGADETMEDTDEAATGKDSTVCASILLVASFVVFISAFWVEPYIKVPTSKDIETKRGKSAITRWFGFLVLCQGMLLVGGFAIKGKNFPDIVQQTFGAFFLFFVVNSDRLVIVWLGPVKSPGVACTCFGLVGDLQNVICEQSDAVGQSIKVEGISDHSTPKKDAKRDGNVLPIGEKKIPRNKVCPCGSRKKYKACCGQQQEDLLCA